MKRKVNSTSFFLMLFLMFSLLLFSIDVRAASIEIWPAERRANNTLFCYSNDWNSMLISLYHNNYAKGKHHIDVPETLAEPVVLSVTLPEVLEFLGVYAYGFKGIKKDFDKQIINIANKKYQKIHIPLNNEELTYQIIKNIRHYRVYVWYKAPETIDDRVSYQLHYGNNLLASGESRLLTAGKVLGDKPKPKHFAFYPSGSTSFYPTIPEDNYERMAEFYKRFGINGLTIPSPLRYSELSAPRLALYLKMLEANRSYGIKNIASLYYLSLKYGGKFEARNDAIMNRGGLVKSMNESCVGLESEKARADWESVHHLFDMILWNWEPTGPLGWPGYEDKDTIDFFAKQEGIEGLTQEFLTTKYRDAYLKFRMHQIARPLFSIKKTIDSVKPMPFIVEQGSGSTSQITYDIYGNADEIDILRPMVYQATPVNYARNLLEMLANTTVPAKKFAPDTTIGWHNARPFRETPQSLLMDTIITAASGCGGLSHWPELMLTDASLIGVHKGLTQIALVEEFYFDGKSVGNIEVKGLPYQEQEIDLGHRKLNIQSPDWRTSVISFTHKHGDEYLFTVLNYNLASDVFVNISSKVISNFYLVNPVEKVYQKINKAGSALVSVAKESPVLWIASADKNRIARCRLIKEGEVQTRFELAKKTFLESTGVKAINLGTTGDITVEYRTIEFGGKEEISLFVKTPTQTISFGSSGGRIYDWQVPGMGNFVGKESFETDGFGMDMLWRPIDNSWSGDEILQELALIECHNNGKEAQVVYEGKLKDFLPEMRLRKTYKVSSKESTILVEITVHNGLVDEIPVRFSHRVRNVISAKSMHFIGEKIIHKTAKGVETVFIVDGLPERLKSEVVRKQYIVGNVGQTYAEFFPETNSGLIFRLPDNVMNVYRWNDKVKNRRSSEWMLQPLSLPAGNTVTLRYSITAVPSTTPEALQKALTSVQSFFEKIEAKSNNLLPYNFDNLNKKGLPADWHLKVSGDNPEAVKVSTVKDENGNILVKMEMEKEANVWMETSKEFQINPKDDYIFMVQVKVENISHFKDWYKGPAGVNIAVYGTDNKHTWLAVYGKGDTDGWLTGILPLPYNDEVRSYFTRSKILLRCRNMTGTVYFRNPMILKTPLGAKRMFELENGEQIVNSYIRLNK
ncbi:MAG: hypothetical protein WDA18_08995 [Candidatus Ratteibacteria bacterium]|jgi:hypothetical protein